MSEAASTQRLEAVSARIGEGLQVRRALPTKRRRLIGAWCFLDHFGPADVAGSGGMRVGPHPHCGLQTVTWLFEGELLHRDSLGSIQVIRPGQLNLMTAGRGLSHSEESPVPRPARLHGVQFWLALPEAARHGAPGFEHHAALPAQDAGDARLTLLVGEYGGERSPARTHSPLVGVALQLPRGGEATLRLDPRFEHGVLVTAGVAAVEDEPLAPGELLFYGAARSRLRVRSDGPASLVLVGGEPFAEPVLMWWNFVGRTKPELTAAAQAWNADDGRFGTVRGYEGARLPAPLPPWGEGVVAYP